MALTTCPECTKSISEHALRCPHCGCEHYVLFGAVISRLSRLLGSDEAATKMFGETFGLMDKWSRLKKLLENEQKLLKDRRP